MKSEVAGFATVTLSTPVPMSLTEKLLESLAPFPPKITCLKPRLAGVICIWPKGVGVGVGVRVGVAVGVGFATPTNFTEVAVLPLVASLVTEIKSRRVPTALGANSTVTTRGDPFG